MTNILSLTFEMKSEMNSVYICASDAFQVRLWLLVEETPIVHELGNFGALSGLSFTQLYSMARSLW